MVNVDWGFESTLGEPEAKNGKKGIEPYVAVRHQGSSWDIQSRADIKKNIAYVERAMGGLGVLGMELPPVQALVYS